MDINELNKYLQSLPEKIIDNAAEIVAETATEYYKESFRKKAFNGNPWKEAKVPKRTGSLLIDSGALLNSIRPSVISSEKVVISAGTERQERFRHYSVMLLSSGRSGCFPDKTIKDILSGKMGYFPDETIVV